jgi:hypothetical protein
MEVLITGWNEVQAFQRLREQQVLGEVAYSLFQVFNILDMPSSPPAEQTKQRNENTKDPDSKFSAQRERQKRR